MSGMNYKKCQLEQSAPVTEHGLWNPADSSGAMFHLSDVCLSTLFICATELGAING